MSSPKTKRRQAPLVYLHHEVRWLHCGGACSTPPKLGNCRHVWPEECPVYAVANNPGAPHVYAYGNEKDPSFGRTPLGHASEKEARTQLEYDVKRQIDISQAAAKAHRRDADACRLRAVASTKRARLYIDFLATLTPEADNG